MKYRINKRTGDRISEIGMGSAYLYEAEMDEAIRTLRAAYEGGINYFDLAAGHGKAFPIWGNALSDVRKEVLYQIHFGADYSKGDYGWSLDLDTVKRSVEWMLKQLRTDYIDYGFIHCQDEASDWATYQKHGIYDHILKLKESGVVRHIGLSSHTPSVIERILDEVPVDMLMFSVNPAYDWGHGEYANGGVDERTAVYRRCEKDGIGISVMKPFSGGQLLDASRSPFGRALTPYQCIRYALDKPGVLTVLYKIKLVNIISFSVEKFLSDFATLKIKNNSKKKNNLSKENIDEIKNEIFSSFSLLFNKKVIDIFKDIYSKDIKDENDKEIDLTNYGLEGQILVLNKDIPAYGELKEKYKNKEIKINIMKQIVDSIKNLKKKNIFTVKK